MISVVIPVLNEEREIAHCIHCLGQDVPHEVLVVDGGSSDGTCERAERAGARVLESPPGRALQMNRGAAAAEGDVLLFLHADLRLAEGGLEMISRCMQDAEVVGGGFTKRYVPSNFYMNAIAWLQNRVRAGIFRDMVGTNAMFVRTGVFQALGGFPEVPFLEDVILSDRLKELGRPALIREPVSVSARKYHREGSLRRSLRNLWIMVQFRALGRSPEQLVRQYRKS